MSTSTYRQFVRSNAIGGLATLSVQLQSLLLLPIVVKQVGAAAYGTYVLLSSLLAVGLTLFPLGLGYCYRRALPSLEQPQDRARVFLPSVTAQVVLVGLGLGVTLALYNPLSALLLKGVVPVNRAIIAAYCFAMFAYNIGGEYFRYSHRIMKLSVAQVLANLLGIGFVLIGASGGIAMNPNILLAIQALSCGILAIWLWWHIAKEIPLRPRGIPLEQYLDDIRIGLPLAAIVVADIIITAGDRYVLGGRLSTEAVGVYASASVLGSLILFVPKLSGLVLPPLLARSIDQQQGATAAMLVKYNIKIYFLIALPAIAGIAIIAHPGLMLLTNPQIADEGALLAPVLAVASAVYGMSLLLNNVLFVERKTAVTLLSYVTGAAGKIGLGFAALQCGTGLLGVAISSVVAQLGSLALAIGRCNLPWREWLDVRFYLKLAASTAVMTVVLLVVRPFIAGVSPILLLAMLIACGVLSYGITLFALAVFTPKEIAFLKSFFPRTIDR